VKKKTSLNKLEADVYLITLDWSLELKEAAEFESRE
jgi:hypothetical protein